MIPRTRWRASASSARRSSDSSQSVLQITIASPFAAARSSAPRATSVKNGFRMSGTISPTSVACPARSVAAEPFGTQPSVEIASRTRTRVDSVTRSGRLTTFETVPTDTPARSATSLIVTAGAFAIHQE